MRAPLEAALGAVAARLHAAGIPFLLGGSALLDALGLDVEVGDIDLMLRSGDRGAFEVVPETLRRTTLAQVRPGARVPGTPEGIWGAPSDSVVSFIAAVGS